MISQLIRLVTFTFPSVEWKTKQKDVTGVMMLGRVLHNNPIPVEYAKVLVREITDMGYTDYPLDHVTPEGVKELR
jgi:hypothetical protein